MAAIDNIMAEMDERRLAQLIGIPHDNARARYPLRKNTVDSFEEYEVILGDYLNRHFSECVSHGAALSRAEAVGRAKEIVEKEYRRKYGGDLISAFNDASGGTNGAIRVQLDLLCEALKAESLEHHVRDVFDRHVRPNAWVEKVAVIRQIIARFGSMLDSSIQADNPERYAHDYRNLVYAIVQGIQRASASFRRL
jgi:hypothetical protein